MKPKHIGLDTTLTAKKMTIETPLGTIESDSGNHFIDVVSIITVVAIILMLKKFIK